MQGVFYLPKDRSIPVANWRQSWIFWKVKNRMTPDSRIQMSYSRIQMSYSLIQMSYSRIQMSYSRIQMSYSRIQMSYSCIQMSCSQLGVCSMNCVKILILSHNEKEETTPVGRSVLATSILTGILPF